MVLPVLNPTKCFWIEAAESPLRDFRSTPEVPEETDVLIVGSGYAGATMAYWVDKYTEHSASQPQVTILEARDICGGATGRNGGQLRPHAYSRYPIWSDLHGPDGAMELIRHEMAHLPAFEQLAKEEGITEEICLQFGDTFDAAMTDEAWNRLRGAYESMRKDHGDENEVFKVCRLIEDAGEAEEFSQMKGAMAAVVHPAGSVWAYKFVHALLQKLLKKGNLNLQANTPVLHVSDKHSDGWIRVTTPRGEVRARTVIHTTNRWASHLRPEFEKLILPERGTVAAIKAPAGFLKRTGAQHWDSSINNYHHQMPPPYNTIMIGGGRPYLAHRPEQCMLRDDDDSQMDGIAEFFRSWPATDVKGWEAESPELERAVDEGGCWTGVETSSADMFPFVGAVPDHDGQWMAAGFAGHGMPRILLSTANITASILESIGFSHSVPSLAAPYPPLPRPFQVTKERVEKLQGTDIAKRAMLTRQRYGESSRKEFCRDQRWLPADVAVGA